MTSKTKTKTKLKSKSVKSVKGHIRNPNYKGKHFKTPEYVKYEKKENKYKEFVKSPLKQLEQREKEVESLIKVNSIAKVIKSPIHPQSDKFTKWVKSLDNPISRKMLLVVPIILFRVSSLIIKNQDIYKQVITVYDQGRSKFKWQDMFLPSKIYQVMLDFFKYIHEKGYVMPISQLFVLIGIFVDDLPRIFTSKDYENLQDLGILEIAKQTARKVIQVQVIAENTLEKQKNDVIQKDFHQKLADTKTQIENTKDLLETSNKIIEKLNTQFDKLEITKSNENPIESIRGTKFTFKTTNRVINIKRGEKRTAEQ